VPGEELYKMRARKVEVGGMVRRASQVQAESAWPGMAQAFDGQGPDFGTGTIPHLLPGTFIDLGDLWFWPLAVVPPFTTVSLSPLTSPESHVRFWPKRTFLWRAASERSDGILYAMCMEYRGGAGRCTVVERESSLVQSRRDWCKSCYQARCVRSASQQCGEPAPVRLSTGIDALGIDIVRR
jgi:hypothetical protein